MFSEPLVALMVMLLLCFIGMLVMFLYVLRSLSTQALYLREGFRRQENILNDLERQLMDMNFILRQSQEKNGAVPREGQETQAGDSGDLRVLFDGADPAAVFAGRTLERSAGATGLFSPSIASAGAAYPSAAGLDPLEQELSSLGISHGAADSEPRRTKTSARAAGELELRLDR